MNNVHTMYVQYMLPTVLYSVYTVEYVLYSFGKKTYSLLEEHTVHTYSNCTETKYHLCFTQ